MLDWVDIEIVGEVSLMNSLAVVVSDEVHADVVLLSSETDLRNPSTRAQAIVVMSDDEAVAIRLHGMNLRSWGIAPSHATPDELRSVVAAVAQGLVVLPLRLAEQLIPQRPLADPSTEKIELTPRESEVLELLSRGLPNKLIAQQLGITEPTAKFHVSAMYAKLGVASRAEAVSKAARAGLITL